MSIFMQGVKYIFTPRNLWKELTTWKAREWVLLLVLLAAQATAFFIGKDYGFNGWVGLITGVLTILSLVLVNQGRITNYLFGFIGSAVWLVISLQNMLIGDIFSQLFYVVMNVLGIYWWQKAINGQNSEEAEGVKARKMTVLQGVLTVIGTIIYAIVVTVSIHAGGNQVWLDGTLLPLGIAGQVLMTLGYRSQWVAWIAIDVINVIIWAGQLATGGPAALSMLVLQIVMLINAFYGTYCWFKNSEENRVPICLPSIADRLK